MNRRELYRKEGSEASPLVAVAGEEWDPVDAPHQVRTAYAYPRGLTPHPCPLSWSSKQSNP